MLISQMQALLESIKQEHGDLPCMFYENYATTLEHFKEEMVSVIDTDGPQGKFKAVLLEDII